MITTKYDGIRFSGQFYFCSFPLVLDTYQGCIHGCRYCFARIFDLNNGTRQGKRFERIDRAINPDQLDRLLSNPPKSPTGEAVRLRSAFHIGGLSDPFQLGVEDQHRISLKCLQILHKHNYPVILSTKNPSFLLQPEYLAAIHKDKFLLQVSLISADDEALKKLEPTVLSATTRLEAIKALTAQGVRTVVRIQPYLYGFTDKTIERLVERIADAGAEGVTVEGMKLTCMMTAPVKRLYNEISQIVGYNIIQFYKQYGTRSGQDMELPLHIRERELLKVRALAKKHNLAFYCADNYFRHLGDSPFCCGVKYEDRSFGPLRHTTGVGLWKAKEKGEVGFDDLELNPCLNCKAQMIGGNIIGARGRKEYKKNKDTTLYTVLRNSWNNPDAIHNPGRFYKALRADSVDEKKNVRYKYTARE